MLLGLPALVYCLVTGFNRAGYAKLAAVGGYALTLGLWLIVPKPVQFYYHYVLPSIFLLAALALALADMRKAGAPRTAYGVLAGSVLVFALFFKILTAAPLDGPMSFLDWTWIEGWR
jgi:dolichyl-phosphate-mannose--protein O-mannosyl transferase